MKYCLVVLLTYISTTHLYGQKRLIEELSTKPVFNGCLEEYLAEHLNYPQLALENNIEGVVVVRFLINEKGEVQDPSIDRIRVGANCEK